VKLQACPLHRWQKSQQFSVAFATDAYSWAVDKTHEMDGLVDSIMQLITSLPLLSEFCITRTIDANYIPFGYINNIKKLSVHCLFQTSIPCMAKAIANSPGLEHLDISCGYWWAGAAIPYLNVLFPNISPDSPPLKLRHLGANRFRLRLDDGIMPHFRSLTSLEWINPVIDDNKSAAEFWRVLKSERMQLSTLKTSVMNDGLLEFLSSYQGMTNLRLVRILNEDSDRFTRKLFQVVLPHHADTLEILHITALIEGDWVGLLHPT
jgi:hypothetical protein